MFFSEHRTLKHLLRGAQRLCGLRKLAWVIGAGALFVAAVRWAPCPDVRHAPLPASFAVTDAAGGVLRQVLAPDGSDCRPVARVGRESWIARAVVAAEDRRFWQHPGVDPLAVCRAVWQNCCGRRVVSGASTLSTLVIRLTHPPSKRRVRVKVREYFQALQIDARLSKEEILTQYLNRAPFGGNVVGIQAASRRYFDKDWSDLSLAEAAVLAGLPQSPSRLRPDRHPERALQRRAYVLGRMRALGIITDGEYAAARAEPLVCRRQMLPFRAPHAVEAVLARGLAHAAPAGLASLVRMPHGSTLGVVETTIEPGVQAAAEAALRARVDELGRDRVSGGAVVVIRVRDGAVLALVGSPDYGSATHAGQVNGALARRSPGSALKPFLYAAAFDGGALTAGTVVQDRAAAFGEAVPVNFDGRFRGAVTAGEALALSLNIPAFRVAREIGVGRLLQVLCNAGLTTLEPDAAHYGLALALGGCEVCLLELAGAYGALASGGVRVDPVLVSSYGTGGERQRVFSAEACWLVNEALGGGARNELSGDVRAAWKTGTSSGMRDAWTFVWNPDYVVGVWLGNPDGRGSEALVGVEAAAPAAWRVFREVARRSGSGVWFGRPAGLELADVCTVSGLEPSAACKARVGDWRIAGVTRRRICGTCMEAGQPDALANRERPVIVQPARGTVYRRTERLGVATVVPLQSAPGTGGPVYWFVNGEPAGEAARGETRLWHPLGVTGRTVVTCAAADGAADQVAVVIE